MHCRTPRWRHPSPDARQSLARPRQASPRPRQDPQASPEPRWKASPEARGEGSVRGPFWSVFGVRECSITISFKVFTKDLLVYVSPLTLFVYETHSLVLFVHQYPLLVYDTLCLFTNLDAREFELTELN